MSYDLNYLEIGLLFCYFVVKFKCEALTFGTNISSMLRKQQNITARATKAKDASCCDAMTMPTGAVIRQRTTTL